MESQVLIIGFLNIKPDQNIGSVIRLKTHIEINIIDIKKVEITWKTKNCFCIDDLEVIQTRSQRQETQKSKSRDFPMSNLNNILNHG